MRGRWVVGGIVVAVAVVVGVVLGVGGGSPKKSQAAPSPSRVVTPSPTPVKDPFAPGACFDAPGLSKVDKDTLKPCTGPHDAESVAREKLPAGLSTLAELGGAARAACGKAVNAAYARQAQKTLFPWYSYASLAQYRAGQRMVTCALSASDSLGGAKLTRPLQR